MLLQPLIEDSKQQARVLLRERIYREEERGDLLCDLMGLLNTFENGTRYIVFGAVRDAEGAIVYFNPEKRAIQRIKALTENLADYLEPKLKVTAVFGDIDGALAGAIEVSNCDNAPYFLTQDVNELLRRGTSWLRVNDAIRLATRDDLAQLFGQHGGADTVAHEEQEAKQKPMAVAVGMNGNPECAVIQLDLIDNSRPPSVVAATRIKKSIEAKKTAANANSDDTGMLRLVHARLYGADSPFIDKGVNTLVEGYNNVAEDHADQDNHYYFDSCALKLNLTLLNTGDNPLENISLILKLPKLKQCRVADRLYPNKESGLSVLESQLQGYPKVQFTEDAVNVRQDIEILRPGTSIDVFEQPLRLAVDHLLTGKRLAIQYVLQSDGLDKPQKGRLKLSFQ